MSCINHQENCGCLQDLLSFIVKLQNCSEECEFCNNGCDKPFLGPTPNVICFNTRPVRFFRCSDGEEWELPYTFDGTTNTSSIFRVESLDGCCATCRILIPNPETTDTTSPYIATNTFFTLNLDCVGAVSCLPDVSIPNL